MTNERRITGTQVIIRYEADHDAVAAAIPEGFEVLNPGEMFMSFQIHSVYNAMAHESDPEPTERQTPWLTKMGGGGERFTEAVLKVPCTKDGVRYLCPFAGWTESHPIVEGWFLHGQRGAFGRTTVTEFHPADPEYSAQRAGLVISVKLRALNEVAAGFIELQEEVTLDQVPYPIGPNLNRRHLIDDVTGRELINDTIVTWVEDYQPKIWMGRAELDIFAPPGSDLDIYRPLRILPSYMTLSVFTAERPNRYVLEEFRNE